MYLPCLPSAPLHVYWHPVELEAAVVVPEQTVVVLERHPAAPSDNQVRRDPGAQVRNPNRVAWFVGNTPFSRLVRSRLVAQAITVAGLDPPSVIHNGVSGQHCVLWHTRGQCFKFCKRSADHVPLLTEEAVAFHAWTHVAFA
jgi:hypothetical protein